MLEEDVAVLVGTAGMGVLGVQRVITERLHGIHVAHVAEIIEVPGGDLLNLVGGTEAIEEVDKGHAATDGRKVRGHNIDTVGDSGEASA